MILRSLSDSALVAETISKAVTVIRSDNPNISVTIVSRIVTFAATLYLVEKPQKYAIKQYALIASNNERENTMSVHGIDWTEYPELFDDDNAGENNVNNAQSLAYTFGTVSTTRKSWKDNRDLSGNHNRAFRHHDSFHSDPRDIDKACRILAPIIYGDKSGATINAGYTEIDLGVSLVVGGHWQTREYPANSGLENLAYYLHKYIVQSPMVGDTAKIIGIWRNNGTIYFDRVTLHEDLFEAMNVAKERGEIAFFDALYGVSIDTETGEHLPE